MRLIEIKSNYNNLYKSNVYIRSINLNSRFYQDFVFRYTRVRQRSGALILMRVEDVMNMMLDQFLPNPGWILSIFENLGGI
jgi:hypothetical protein